MQSEHSKPVRLATAALRAALADDWPKASRAVQRLSDECGGQGLNQALCAWVDTYVAHARDGDMTPSRGRALAINVDTGSTSREGMPPHIEWAMRVVETRAALDHAGYQACIRELPDDGAEIGKHVGAVLQCIAQTINGLPRGFALMGRS